MVIQDWPITKRGVLLDTPAALAHHFGPHLAAAPTERMFAAFLDRRYRLLGAVLLGQGDQSTTPVCLPSLVRILATTGAASVVLAHNHPSGRLRLSFADHQITRRARALTEALGAVFLDHLLFVPDGRWISWRLLTEARQRAQAASHGPTAHVHTTRSGRSSRTSRLATRPLIAVSERDCP